MKPARTLASTASVVTLVLLATVVAAANIETKDLIFLPAPAEAIDSHVTVAGHPRIARRGSFFITFVTAPRSTLLTRLVETFNPDATIMPLSAYYGPRIPSPTQQQHQMVTEMLDSKLSAELAAFNTLGHKVAGEQVAVVGIDQRSKAVGRIRVGDIVVGVDGRHIDTPQQLRRAVQSVRPGMPVTLLMNRAVAGGHQVVQVTVPTMSITGKAAVGILLHVTFAHAPTHLPYRVTIDTQDIGGPSAGLIFALTIINRFSPVDLTHGQKVAGTGTIDADGYVGPIGGVKQKVIGARQAGARYFLVPLDNYHEAAPYAHGISLVPVATLDDALAFLRRLR